ncbi:MAG: hypothetical protein DMG08_09800 [Acidobacteria bacterium]|nr:MAG: hypothetical protein DMG08_09800 [Acidobacteriota bacterium]
MIRLEGAEFNKVSAIGCNWKKWQSTTRNAIAHSGEALGVRPAFAGRLDTQSFPRDAVRQTKAAASCRTPKGASIVQNFDSHLVAPSAIRQVSSFLKTTDVSEPMVRSMEFGLQAALRRGQVKA